MIEIAACAGRIHIVQSYLCICDRLNTNSSHIELEQEVLDRAIIYFKCSSGTVISSRVGALDMSVIRRGKCERATLLRMTEFVAGKVTPALPSPETGEGVHKDGKG